MSKAGPIAEEPVQPLHRLCRVSDVEMFDAGIHRGMPYTTADIDEFVQNFDKYREQIKPTIVLGHEELQKWGEYILGPGVPAFGESDTDVPAFGVISRVWRDGTKLMADWADMPEKLAAMIRSKVFRECSIEHYGEDMPLDVGDGNPIREKVLRRVALLGGELAQVKTLADLPTPVYQHADRVRIRLKPTTKPRTPSVDARAYCCFSEVIVMVDRDQAIQTIKAAMPNLDQAAIDTMTDDQVKALAAACAAPPSPSPEAAMADFDRMKVTQDLVAAGQDPAALEAMGDEELKALAVSVLGMQFKEATPATPAPSVPAPAAPSNAGKLVTIQAKTFAEANRALATAKQLSEKLNADLAKVAAREKEARKVEVIAFCDRLVNEGRMLPVHKDLIGKLLTLVDDSKKVHKFSDGKTPATEFEVTKETLEKFPILVTFGERIEPNSLGVTSDEHEVAVVQNFAAHTFSERTKAESYVNGFRDLQKKKPGVKASDYGVPAGFNPQRK